MKQLLIIFLLLAMESASAQVQQRIPSGTVLGNSSGGAAAPSAQSSPVISGPYRVAPPTVTDSVPIIQGVQLGETAAGFVGNYYSDPVFGFGYNSCYTGGTITTPCVGTDPWGQDIEMEADYEHVRLPIGVTGNTTGTATAGTTTTVLTDSAQTLTSSTIINSILYDSTRSASSVITANTATTITVSPAIAGMASGDSYQILGRDAENRWQVSFASTRWPAIQWNVDKNRSLASGTLHMLNMELAVPCDPSYGLEFIADNLANSAGAGTGDVATINCTNQLILKGFKSGSDSVVVIGLGQTSANNARVDMYSGNGTSAPLAARMTSVNVGRVVMQVFDLNGANAATAWDFTRAGASIVGNSALSSLTLTGNTASIALASTGATVTGAVLLPSLATSSAGTTGTLCWTTGTGNVNVDTTTTCLASDGRLKMNVEPLDAGLSEVMKLKPVSYELKPQFNPTHLGRQVGLVAQDVIKVDPRLASVYQSGPDAGTPSGVRYEQLTAVLIKAIQEQQHEIDELKSHLHRRH